MQPRSFRIKIALFNLIGYCTAVASAYLLDGNLPTHIKYGAREYPHISIWFMISPVVFLTSYLILSLWQGHAARRGITLVGSSLPLLLFGLCASLSFPPERPHVGILISNLSFCAISLLTVWLRISLGDFAFVNATEVPYDARLEHLKATVTTWQMVAVYGAAGYLVFVMSWAGVLYVAVSLTVKSEADRFTLGQGELVQILIITICVIAGPLVEAFRNVLAAVAHLSEIRHPELLQPRS
jgi:hypothetical protein